MDTNIKYKPKTLSDFAFATKELEHQINRYVFGQTVKPLILHGSTGTGKSTLAKLIPQAIDGPNVIIDYIKAEDLNSAKEVRAKLASPSSQFDKIFVYEGQKQLYIVIEEVNFDPKAKGALRQCIDEAEGRAIFIFTTNELNKIDPMVNDRCNVVLVPPCPPSRFLPHAKKILKAEGIDLDDETLLTVLETISEDNPSNRAYYSAMDDIIEGMSHGMTVLPA